MFIPSYNKIYYTITNNIIDIFKKDIFVKISNISLYSAQRVGIRLVNIYKKYNKNTYNLVLI